MQVIALRRVAAPVLLLFVCLAGTCFADSRDVDKNMRSAERAFFAGKIQEASDLLKTAEEEAATISQSGENAEKNKIKRLQGRLEKLRQKVDKRLADSQGATGPATAVSAAAGGGGDSELPSYVVNKVDTINGQLDIAFDSVAAGKAGSAKNRIDDIRQQIDRARSSYKKYSGAEPLFAKLDERYTELEEAIGKLESDQAGQKAAAEQAQADQQAASAVWLEKLKPFATGLGQPGYDPEKYFVGGYTAEKDEMAKRTQIYGELQTVLAEYRAGGPGDKATDELQRVLRELEYNIKSFNESSTNMAGQYLSEATQKLAHLDARTNQEVAKIGSGQLPLPMSDFALKDFLRVFESARGLLGENDPQIQALQQQYEQVLAKNGKIGAARVAETRMMGDAFDGSELAELKATTQEVLTKAQPGVEILRTTIISKDWQEESVIEWTDTSRSALRHRVTWSVSAQIAGKLNGEVKLYTLFIVKDRRSDGSWGALHGHVMFTDPILEENVNK